ncbi:superoxide dismutase [Aquirufa ecclesiirivi]|uniref:Superoxide dismutase n=1 Tax=Aquirufa ecclesiirivi TaxID=2715124 RepID=A0ABT4JIW8_9BACT|nr:superoxide dismutase [Aquirufa ecclesiirivi]MCZ2471776.1 superoxide dismutase [Aquirufa ecclesiirivi]MCZ2476207.1 superoxide dismutase [Aquirufa ecclesiirivi]MDF0693489.1 superoxide dismutase [Aquirufa ecclesiirivi]NHC49396.1 superoxide dismutase [Aquirufa ecclesiirivi]
MAFELAPLPYANNALEPHFDALTMEIHHDRHHNAYVTNLNAALAGSPSEGKSLEELFSQISSLSPAIRNNGGGHYNHDLFWNILSPNGGGAPVGTLAKAIEAKFGSFDAFKEEFKKAGLTRFGSGWAWLVAQKDGSVAVSSTPNQDNPLMDVAEVKGFPVIGLDVWEHAYYLKFQNKRPDYVDAFWNVIDWNAAENRYVAAQK